jgi:acyl-CoA reductase-like NAD-dependent aldehyde dehydrogenase
MNVAFRKVAPALVAGNCAILKPSELAGLTCMYLGQLATEAGIPPGVFSVIPGDRDAGAALAANPAVMAISFTGSSATGSAIIANTSERVGATFLELGGKSALVVFDDVDTAAAVKTVMNGLLTNGGQICTAHSRLIVHKNMAPKLLPALKAALEKVEFATSPLEDVDALPGWDNMWAGKLQAGARPLAAHNQQQWLYLDPFL